MNLFKKCAAHLLGKAIDKKENFLYIDGAEESASAENIGTVFNLPPKTVRLEKENGTVFRDKSYHSSFKSFKDELD